MIRQAARRSIDEITLLGARRQLLDVGTLAAGTGFQFIDGATIAYRSDSAAFVVPLDGGGPRRLVDVPAKTRVSAMAVAHDRRWIAGPMWDPTRQEVNQIELISVESGQRRVIEVPFRLMFAIPPIFTAGDRSLLVFGDRADDTTSAKIYDVPLDGGAPRLVGAIGANPNRPSASASPNGQSIVYTIQENRTTALLLVDLRPVLSRLSLAPTHR